jgi:hypothetical protein
MICPARIVIGFLLAGFAVHPGRADIIVNWLDTPIDLSTEFSPVYYPLDLNSDGVVDYTFAASITSVGFFREEDNQYLIVPSPPPNIGGFVAPVQGGYEIGSASGNSELDWFGNDDFAMLGVWVSTGTGGYFPGQRAYVGVELGIDGATHYGWIDIYVSDLGPGALIYGWGYESTPGMPIIAGAVPEPSTIVLMLTGSLALLFSGAKRNSANNRLHTYG